MLETNFLVIVPKCPDHGINLEWRSFIIDTMDGQHYYQPTFSYCSMCGGYHLATGLEKDEKNVALDMIKPFKKSYEVSDIVNIKIRKR